MRRFYLESTPKKKDILELPQEESRHIGKVLRMQIGNQIELVNGQGHVFTAELTDNHYKKCKVQIIEETVFPKDDFHIHIAVAPTKNLDRFSYFVEKSTELGIHEITPLLCANNERKSVNLEKLEKVIIGAMKQSKRLYKPVLHPLTPLDDFLQSHPNGLIAHCYDTIEATSTIPLQAQNCPVLIGPEGDFSREEVEHVLSFNYKAISLGKTRLRTETAALYACMLAKTKFE